jgi:hypothetical protein
VVSSGEVRPDDADNRVVYPIEVLVMVNPRVVGEGPLNWHATMSPTVRYVGIAGTDLRSVGPVYNVEVVPSGDMLLKTCFWAGGGYYSQSNKVNYMVG